MAVSSDRSPVLIAIAPHCVAEREPVGPAAGGVDFSASAAGDLHAMYAEAADAEDEESRADADLTLADQAVIHAGDGVRENGRRSIVQAVRQANQVPFRRQRVLGMAAVAFEADSLLGAA